MPTQPDSPAVFDALLTRTAFGAPLRWTTLDEATARTVISYDFWTLTDGSAPKAVPAGITRALTPEEQAGVTLAMQRIEAVAAITFRLDESLNEAADLRFGVADFGLQHGAATTARAFGGDGAMMWAETWLNDEAALPDPDRAGGVGQAEIIKQLLRALGLQPPHARELSPGLKRRTGSSRPPRSGLRP